MTRVPATKLRLVIGKLCHHLDCGRPGVLNLSSILQFDEQTTVCFVSELVNIMNSAIAVFIRRCDVVVFVCIVFQDVIEPCMMNVVAELVQLFNALKNQSAARNVMHPRQFHAGLTMQLIDYCVTSLEPLSDLNVFVLSPLA